MSEKRSCKCRILLELRNIANTETDKHEAHCTTRQHASIRRQGLLTSSPHQIGTTAILLIWNTCAQTHTPETATIPDTDTGHWARTGSLASLLAPPLISRSTSAALPLEADSINCTCDFTVVVVMMVVAVVVTGREKIRRGGTDTGSELRNTRLIECALFVLAGREKRDARRVPFWRGREPTASGTAAERGGAD